MHLISHQPHKFNLRYMAMLR